MRSLISELSEALRLLEKKKVNPWAVCTSSVGRKDKAKYERCVLAVKKGQSEGLEELDFEGTKLTLTEAEFSGDPAMQKLAAQSAEEEPGAEAVDVGTELADVVDGAKNIQKGDLAGKHAMVSYGTYGNLLKQIKGMKGPVREVGELSPVEGEAAVLLGWSDGVSAGGKGGHAILVGRGGLVRVAAENSAPYAARPGDEFENSDLADLRAGLEGFMKEHSKALTLPEMAVSQLSPEYQKDIRDYIAGMIKNGTKKFGPIEIAGIAKHFGLDTADRANKTELPGLVRHAGGIVTY